MIFALVLFLLALGLLGWAYYDLNRENDRNAYDAEQGWDNYGKAAASYTRARSEHDKALGEIALLKSRKKAQKR